MSVRTESHRAAPSRVVVLLVMCVGYFLVLLDVTIVNVALPTIGRRLHAGVSGLQWVVDGYALALAGLMLTGGTLGDVGGHKRVVLCGLTVFGIASLGCGLALLGATFAVVSAGHAGSAWPVVISAGCAVAAAAGFLVAERRARDPLLPLGLLRRPAFVTANGVAGAMNLATLGLLFVLTLYLQDVRGEGALMAGIVLLPLFAPLSVLAPVGGRIVARTGPRSPMLGGLLVAAVGVGLLTLSDATTGYLILLPAVLLWGVGLAFLTPAVVSAALSTVPAGRAGLGSAVNNTTRQAAGAIGIAAFGAIAPAPDSPGFIHGFHTVALIAAALFLAAAAATLTLPAGLAQNTQ